MSDTGQIVDLLVIGGGVNGAGIARDAAGRGARVVLCEADDLASATSSSSTKLFHGGLRYLEQYAFLLVRKALIEREILLRNMPHIARARRFVLPHVKGMRPAWMLRLGLFFYDSLGGRGMLLGTRVLNLSNDTAGGPLKPGLVRAFEYSDGCVDDARLVVLNAMDAAQRGAVIHTRTKVVSAVRRSGCWRVTVMDTNDGSERDILARALVNAAGPWVNPVLGSIKGEHRQTPIRLVRGSHIVTKKLFEHDRAYFFQNPDGRIIFAIPYLEDFTLIGTTDEDHKGDPRDAHCSESEQDYLCRSASKYLERPVTKEDIVWTYAGVRPLDDDLNGDASKASRDYHIAIEDENGTLPLMTIFGGKITTYRKLSEEAVDKLATYNVLKKSAWTARSPLPGGDFPYGGHAALEEKLKADFTFLKDRVVRRLVAGYGTLAWDVLAGTKKQGIDFGCGLSEAELKWLTTREWARTAEDIIWRRTKCGLWMDPHQRALLDNWLQENIA